MHVDRARHHDLAGRVIGRVRDGAARRRLDDAPIADPDVADSIAAMRRIDHAAAGDARPHRATSGSAAAIFATTSATDIASLGRVAPAETSVPSGGWCCTPS